MSPVAILPGHYVHTVLADLTSSTKPETHNLAIATPQEEDRAKAICSMHIKFGEVRTCSSRDMRAVCGYRSGITGRQTERQTRPSQYSASSTEGGVINTASIMTNAGPMR